ncbi:MAG TPA: hypothetical protein VFH52_07385 [Rhodanobacteraceae bacterium]|nr:hypothetical protein [Rhodanobacteraceae bacterium]
MPAASALLVERLQDDLFALTWWDYRGNRIEELTNRRWLDHRIGTLTVPSVTVTEAGVTVDLPNSGTNLPKMGMEHAP